MLDVNTARRQMIEQQVRAWEVLDLKVLEAMERVPREEFTPPAYRELAFADMCVPLGHGQSMLAPKLEGRILQALELRPDDGVLEVGTGSGYFAACLGRLARTVRSIEIFPELAAAARANLARSDSHNVTVEAAGRCPCTTVASRAGSPTADGCSRWWARARSWRPCASPVRPRASSCARACSRRSWIRWSMRPNPRSSCSEAAGG